MDAVESYDDDPYVSCPYDKCHRVPRSRLQRHLTKCEKMYPKLAICPYNATHRFPSEEITDHSLNCPSKPKEIPGPKAKAAQGHKAGALSAPTPIFEHEYLSKDDPDYECWDN